jgi:iron complex outermembrane receptor protein
MVQLRAGLVGVAASLLCTLILLSTAYARADERTPQAFDIGPQSLATALAEFARQSREEILFAPDVVAQKQSGGVRGTMPPLAALKILLKDSGLPFSSTPNGAILVGTAGGSALAVSATEQTSDSKEEGKKSSSQDFRVAQVDQGQTSSTSTVEKQDEQTSKKRFVQLEEVVVTGSRIPTHAKEGAQDVKSYTKEQIEQSGQTTVSDFLNTLPSISVALTEGGLRTISGATTVQLRGLPIGTTLVLINGRRVEASGLEINQNFFDLNNIPLAAVERVEVIADGSSAIYGSDAVAGVVNIILKKDLNGLEASAKYGAASGLDDRSASLAWGQTWQKGSLSIIGGYQSRGELTYAERALTASNDYRAFGGPNANGANCSPGNIYSTTGANLPGLNAPFAAVPAGFSGTPSIQEFQGTAGTLNKCALFADYSLIPPTRRSSVLVQGSFEPAPSVEMFTELMYSHTDELSYAGHPYLFGSPGFQSFKVAPSNPYNPFGTTVGVSQLLTSLPRTGALAKTDFFRALLGGRGTIANDWRWELSAWQSADFTDQTLPLNTADIVAIQNALNSSNPATALNPFVSGPPASQAILRSFYSDSFQESSGRGTAVNGFIRGPLLQLPSGPIELVLGGEYDRNALASNAFSSQATAPLNLHRNSYAFFGEARIPLIANRANPEAGDTLAVTMAGRRDSYEDFGSATTPQFGVEWRPFNSLLLRATYAEAFKAPSLFELNAPQQTFQSQVVDPLTGTSVPITLIEGGNPKLHPQTGQSHTFGIVYSSPEAPDLQLSLTNWTVDEDETINFVPPQLIADNASSFPGNIVRGPPGPNGAPGPITTIIDTNVNFGRFSVAGLDYQLKYRYRADFGAITPSIAVTEIYRYQAALTPGTPPTDRLIKASLDGVWAPRWKGTASLTWNLGPYAAALTGRYVGRYLDYDGVRQLGNFWLCDANVRYALGQDIAGSNPWLKGSYVEFGGVNILNKQPQFSTFLFDLVGYDPSQADIRGRFLYAQVGIKF